MQMNWQTMERTGKAFAAVRDLLAHQIPATNMTVACRSGYSEAQKAQALISMHKQGALVPADEKVVAQYSFTQPLPKNQRTPALEQLEEGKNVCITIEDREDRLTEVNEEECGNYFIRRQWRPDSVQGCASNSL